jgi:hypothetical protein
MTLKEYQNKIYLKLQSVNLPATSSSSSLPRQALVGPGLLKKLCPFVPAEGDFLPILDP